MTDAKVIMASMMSAIEDLQRQHRELQSVVEIQARQINELTASNQHLAYQMGIVHSILQQNNLHFVAQSVGSHHRMEVPTRSHEQEPFEEEFTPARTPDAVHEHIRKYYLRPQCEDRATPQQEERPTEPYTSHRRAVLVREDRPATVESEERPTDPYTPHSRAALVREDHQPSQATRLSNESLLAAAQSGSDAAVLLAGLLSRSS